MFLYVLMDFRGYTNRYTVVRKRKAKARVNPINLKLRVSPLTCNESVGVGVDTYLDVSVAVCEYQTLGTTNLKNTVGVADIDMTNNPVHTILLTLFLV